MARMAGWYSWPLHLFPSNDGDAFWCNLQMMVCGVTQPAVVASGVVRVV